MDTPKTDAPKVTTTTITEITAPTSTSSPTGATPAAADILAQALTSMSFEDMMDDSIPFSKYTGEESMTLFRLRESKKQVRRFYLTYPANAKDGSELRLYIEVEVDEDDPTYLNYWVGCEEFTEKHYIASCQGDLNAENPIDIVKVKHIQKYVAHITEK